MADVYRYVIPLILSPEPCMRLLKPVWAY